jgi:hypothetical protein
VEYQNLARRAGSVRDIRAPFEHHKISYVVIPAAGCRLTGMRLIQTRPRAGDSFERDDGTKAPTRAGAGNGDAAGRTPPRLRGDAMAQSALGVAMRCRPRFSGRRAAALDERYTQRRLCRSSWRAGTVPDRPARWSSSEHDRSTTRSPPSLATVMTAVRGLPLQMEAASCETEGQGSDMSGTTAGGAPPGSRYADQRPYAVVGSLADLHGPTAGTVVLDRRLDWSGRAQYDLANPRRLATLYETVLREATGPEDLARWLDGATLVRLWPELVLPPQVRQLWEARFPQFAAGRRSAA